jgi:hypothetical protein
VKRLRLTEKELHVARYYDAAKRRSIKHNIPFNLTIEYLRGIATNFCPIFYTPLHWGKSGLGKGKMKPNGPQLDRIIPELGYVIGNVAFISNRANRIKDNGTMQEHYDIADWIWNHIHVTEKSTTPVPAGHYSKSEEHTKHGTVPTSGAWEDNYDANHHRGAVYGEDSDHRTQEGSGNSLAHRNRKVEPLTTPESEQDDWELHPTYGWIERRGGRLFD